MNHRARMVYNDPPKWTPTRLRLRKFIRSSTRAVSSSILRTRIPAPRRGRVKVDEAFAESLEGSGMAVWKT